MRIVFMGTPDYATRIFQELFTCKEFEVPLLITQPDKPVGRKQELTPPHIKEWSLKNQPQAEIYQPTTLKCDEAKEIIASYKPDFIVVAAYGQILPRAILDIAPCINLHASLLPLYRGASPIQSSILNGDKFTGITAMMMEEGLDSGDILGYSFLKLDEHIKVDRLFEELSVLAAKLTVKVLKNFSKLSRVPQKSADTNYAKKITKEDGLVDFSLMSAQEIYTKFRAYDPWPGIYLASGLKLKEIKISSCESKLEAGQIAQLDKEIIVTCKVGCISVLSLQPASKKQMSADEYARGKRLSVGTLLV